LTLLKSVIWLVMKSFPMCWPSQRQLSIPNSPKERSKDERNEKHDHQDPGMGSHWLRESDSLNPKTQIKPYLPNNSHQLRGCSFSLMWANCSLFFFIYHTLFISQPIICVISSIQSSKKLCQRSFSKDCAAVG
jgi:hypothetical protein